MFQEHKEISQMRRSAQYYQNKIHHHRRRTSRSPSPSPSLLLDEIQNASLLLDESEVSMADTSVAEELSEAEGEKSLSIATPSDDLEHSSTRAYSDDFQSYSASPEPVPTATAKTETVSEEEEGEGEEGEEDRTLTDSRLLSSHTPVRSKPKSKTSPPSKKSPPGGKKSKSPKSLKSPSSDSRTVKELEKLASSDPRK